MSRDVARDARVNVSWGGRDAVTMCGILGLVAEVGKVCELSRTDIERMRDTMSARGPDGAGYFARRNVVFAHRRLAIRDREGGSQPWLSPDGQSVLVYNGELYNDAQLRRQLRERGYTFRTSCDTETLMAAWETWGPDCVGHLNGMFAFGVYHFPTETLFLARDRCGVKPLFFAPFGEGLVFASSIPALLAHPRISREPYWPAISHYLTTLRLTLARATLFEAVYQLLPGERLLWRSGDLEVDSFWNPTVAPESEITFPEAVNVVETRLRRAVADQLVSDVPVGMFLSGGVDSSTIACLVRDTRASGMLGMCGGGSDDVSDDFVYSRRCAEHVGFGHDAVQVTPDVYAEQWLRLIDAYQTPVSTPSDVIILRLAEEMKKSVGVVLGGEGADEALCGYGVQHWSGRDFELSQDLLRGRWAGTDGAAAVFRRSLRTCYGRETFASDVDHYFALNSLIPSAVKPQLLQPHAWVAAEQDELIWSLYQSLLSEEREQPLQRRTMKLLHRVNLESLLSRLDSATMLASLEARVPYTDHEFVEAAFRLPQSHAIARDPSDRGTPLAAGELDRRGMLHTKRVLRSCARRLMPADLADRRKASFPTPVARWLTGRWRDRTRQRLLESPFGRAHFQPHALQSLAENPEAAGMWLWPILNVLEWGDRVLSAA